MNRVFVQFKYFLTEQTVHKRVCVLEEGVLAKVR